jgi:hypothetical protein
MGSLQECSGRQGDFLKMRKRNATEDGNDATIKEIGVFRTEISLVQME